MKCYNIHFLNHPVLSFAQDHSFLQLIKPKIRFCIHNNNKRNLYSLFIRPICSYCFFISLGWNLGERKKFHYSEFIVPVWLTWWAWSPFRPEKMNLKLNNSRTRNQSFFISYHWQISKKKKGISWLEYLGEKVPYKHVAWMLKLLLHLLHFVKIFNWFFCTCSKFIVWMKWVASSSCFF